MCRPRSRLNGKRRAQNKFLPAICYSRLMKRGNIAQPVGIRSSHVQATGLAFRQGRRRTDDGECREGQLHRGPSEVGTRIWGLIETPQEIDAVCAPLLEEFEVAPETCRAEVQAFLNELVTHGAVAFDPATSA